MATDALIHGAGGDSWYWHLVVPRQRALGHEVIAIVIVLDLALDLACDDDGAGLSEYAGCVVDAVHPPALARPDGIVDWLEHFRVAA